VATPDFSERTHFPLCPFNQTFDIRTMSKDEESDYAETEEDDCVITLNVRMKDIRPYEHRARERSGSAE